MNDTKNQNLLFGKKALLDAINNKLDIDYIVLHKNGNKLNIREVNKYKVIYKDQKYFDNFKNVNHQNIITVIKKPLNYLTLDQAMKKYKSTEVVTCLILDENEDPRNFGSIIRSAVAFNVDLIIFKNNHQAQINDLVIKTSIGAIYQIDLVKVANLSTSIDKLKDNGFWIYASALSDKSINLNQVDFDKKSAIILGNENHGISNIVLKNADFTFKIPMSSKVQSLNISVAAGIILNKRFNN